MSPPRRRPRWTPAGYILSADDRTQQLWAAAAPSNEAVDRVLDAISEGWTARLLEEQLKPPPDAISNMVPGEVRKLGETKDWSDLN